MVDSLEFAEVYKYRDLYVPNKNEVLWLRKVFEHSFNKKIFNTHNYRIFMRILVFLLYSKHLEISLVRFETKCI